MLIRSIQESAGFEEYEEITPINFSKETYQLFKIEKDVELFKQTYRCTLIRKDVFNPEDLAEVIEEEVLFFDAIEINGI